MTNIKDKISNKINEGVTKIVSTKDEFTNVASVIKNIQNNFKNIKITDNYLEIKDNKNSVVLYKDGKWKLNFGK